MTKSIIQIFTLFMKVISLLGPLVFLNACQRETVFENWQNVINAKRTLRLKEGEFGKNRQVFSPDGHCHYDVELQGDKEEGKIKILASREREEKCLREAPHQLNFKAHAGRLQVCSDYSDGRHTCESMVKNSL